MSRLYLRIYIALLAVLAVFALLSLAAFHFHAEWQRAQEQAAWAELAGAWAEPLLEPLLEAEAPPLQRLAWVAVSLLGLLALVGVAAYPVARSLTARLEALRAGVQAFGDGDLERRVPSRGRDEVAALARSFNAAADRIETLVRAQQRLLANASHELRSPLARLQLALELHTASTDAAARARHLAEARRNIAELDALVEEILLAARLDAAPTLQRASVHLYALASDEGARVGANVTGEPLTVLGDERLLRRALRNLLDNACRYAPGLAPEVRVQADGDHVALWVCDRGPGVPPDWRERIFEPFSRLPGHAEDAGGVGLGLTLVRQIASVHGGTAHCIERAGGGACFVLRLPRA
ncbi:sensor histidine kinase [Tepidimonas charontis]|uniref:histidine kinase n=1 Tax=Tepidimonas charontis TaxID=2267262 RepID=A0A554XEK0_9BURK|nr:HAMP domain-containing sensor histidine kinase [Tepidimonas charontis]TSE34278.1 Sensor protein RstB [Tepidimonas charontis]